MREPWLSKPILYATFGGMRKAGEIERVAESKGKASRGFSRVDADRN